MPARVLAEYPDLAAKRRPRSRLALALAGTFTESKHPRDHGRFARALGAASVPTPGVDRPGPDPAAGYRGTPDADHPSVRAVLARADRVAGQGGASGPQVANLARSHYAADPSARAAFGSADAFAATARRAHEDRAGVVRARTDDLKHRPTGSLVTEGRALRAKPDKTPAEHARLKAVGAEIDARGQSPKDWWTTPEHRARYRAFRAGLRQESSWPAGTTAGGVALAADAGLRGLRSKLAAAMFGAVPQVRPASRLALALSGMSDTGWRTIHGVHVHIGADGKIDKGPAKFVGTHPTEHGHDGKPDGTSAPAGGRDNGAAEKKGEPVTDAQVQAWYDDDEVPDGWMVHGRNKSHKDLNTGHAIQTTDDLEVGRQYAGDKGGIWYVRPTAKAVVLEASSGEEREKIATALVDDVEAGGRNNTPKWADDFVDKYGREKAIEKIADEMDVTDIVDSAKAYDDDHFNYWVYERFGADWVNLPNGSVILNATDESAVERHRVGRH